MKRCALFKSSSNGLTGSPLMRFIEWKGGPFYINICNRLIEYVWIWHAFREFLSLHFQGLESVDRCLGELRAWWEKTNNNILACKSCRLYRTLVTGSRPCGGTPAQPNQPKTWDACPTGCLDGWPALRWTKPSILCMFGKGKSATLWSTWIMANRPDAGMVSKTSGSNKQTLAIIHHFC